MTIIVILFSCIMTIIHKGKYMSEFKQSKYINDFIKEKYDTFKVQVPKGQKELIAERDRYGANNIRPGLTGWAQINGRDEVSWEEKARLDGEYVQKMSFSFDVKCFFKTIVAVLKREGMVEGTAGQVKNKEETHRTD